LLHKTQIAHFSDDVFSQKRLAVTIRHPESSVKAAAFTAKLDISTFGRLSFRLLRANGDTSQKIKRRHSPLKSKMLC
jgi:hypothetical protein